MPDKRAKRHFEQLSVFERDLIIVMKTAGWSTLRVAGQVDRSECAVTNCWEQWTREATHTWKTGSGATRKTTRRDDRRIVWQALVDPTVTRSTIRADEGVAIVLQTISRHLSEADVKPKRPFRTLPLTPEHRQLRLQWCQNRSIWNVTNCQKIVMNPGLFWEQMITVYGCGGALVSGTIPPHCSTSHCPHRWCNGLGAIAYDSRSTLIVMRGILTSQRYVDDILRSHVGPFLNGLPGAILQQDNARPHTGRVPNDFLRHFQTLQSPAAPPICPL
ncbi:transposable element Tc1 transposase [Trichonephila clavipes]|nr:transposable element Tc1 transposase [Trichonephila clavipes]